MRLVLVAVAIAMVIGPDFGTLEDLGAALYNRGTPLRVAGGEFPYMKIGMLRDA